MKRCHAFKYISSALNNVFFRIVFEQPGLHLLPQEDQVGDALCGGLRQLHALLHQHRAGAPPRPLQVRV